MNFLLLLSSRIAPFAAAAGLLAALGATPAHALVASGTPFNGFFQHHREPDWKLCDRLRHLDKFAAWYRDGKLLIP